MNGGVARGAQSGVSGYLVQGNNDERSESDRLEGRKVHVTQVPFQRGVATSNFTSMSVWRAGVAGYMARGNNQGRNNSDWLEGRKVHVMQVPFQGGLDISNFNRMSVWHARVTA